MHNQAKVRACATSPAQRTKGQVELVVEVMRESKVPLYLMHLLHLTTSQTLPNLPPQLARFTPAQLEARYEIVMKHLMQQALSTAL